MNLKTKKIAIFGFSANPPTKSHLAIFRKLMEIFDLVVVVPRGADSNKPSITEITSAQRKDMVKLVFPIEPKMDLDFYDLDNNIFTPTIILDEKYKTKFKNAEIWHVVGGDIVQGGANENSEIQKKWNKGKEIWKNLNWAVISHSGLPVATADLPPHSFFIEMPAFEGRSTTVRNRLALGQSVSNLIPPAVEKYIKEKGLYK